MAVVSINASSRRLRIFRAFSLSPNLIRRSFVRRIRVQTYVTLPTRYPEPDGESLTRVEQL